MYKTFGLLLSSLIGLLVISGAISAWHYWGIDGAAASLLVVCGLFILWEGLEKT
jgi:hypothetical protein